MPAWIRLRGGILDARKPPLHVDRALGNMYETGASSGDLAGMLTTQVKSARIERQNLGDASLLMLPYFGAEDTGRALA